MTPAHGSKGHLKRLLWKQFQLPQIYRHLETDLIYAQIPKAPLYSKAIPNQDYHLAIAVVMVTAIALDIYPLTFA